MRVSTATLALAGILLSTPAHPQGPCVPDQEQADRDYGFWFDENFIRWQEFIPTASQVCDLEIDLNRSGSAGNVLLELRDSAQSLLWTGTIPEAQVKNGWNRVTPDAPVPVISGTSCYLYVRTDEPSGSSDNRYFWRGKTDSSYHQGITDVEGSWPGYDYTFRVHGSEPAGTLTWLQGPDLPIGLIDAGAAVHDDILYVVAGSELASQGYERRETYIAQLQPDGSVLGWVQGGLLSVPRSMATLHVHEDRLHCALGYPSGATAGSVESADADGAAGSWQLDTVFDVRYGHTAWIHGDRLYVAGGWYRSSVMSAPILSDGSLGSSRMETAMLDWRYAADAVVLGDDVFVLGGYKKTSSGLPPYLDVWRSRIAPDGSLSPWSNAGTIPTGVIFGEALVMEEAWVLLAGDGRLWAGEATGDPGARVLGNWVDLGPLPGGIEYRMAAAVRGTWLYLAGGTATSTGKRDVWFTDVSEACLPPTVQCYSEPNSTGQVSELRVEGSTSVSANDFWLVAEKCPPMAWGVFVYAAETGNTPFGDGRRCLSGPLFRLPPVPADASGVASYWLDLADPPHSSGQVTAGSTWSFQYVFRDEASPAGMNTSSAVRVVFCS